MATAADDRRDDRTIDIYIKDTLELLKLRTVLDRHSLRSWIYKISEDINSRQKSKNNRLKDDRVYWTVNARRKYDENPGNDFKGLHLEHPVPRGKVVRWLCELPNPKEAHVKRAIDLFLLTCWVTTAAGGEYQSSEECALNRYEYTKKSGHRIKNSMPPGWCYFCGDEWDRYKHVRHQLSSVLSDLTDKDIILQNPINLACSCHPDAPG